MKKYAILALLATLLAGCGGLAQKDPKVSFIFYGDLKDALTMLSSDGLTVLPSQGRPVPIMINVQFFDTPFSEVVLGTLRSAHYPTGTTIHYKKAENTVQIIYPSR